MTYQCLICFENCKHPAILDLNWNVNIMFIINVIISGGNEKLYDLSNACRKSEILLSFKDKTNYHFLLDLLS